MVVDALPRLIQRLCYNRVPVPVVVDGPDGTPHLCGYVLEVPPIANDALRHGGRTHLGLPGLFHRTKLVVGLS